jgi:hypothetical protein
VNEQQRLVVGKKVLPENGYHAELLCISSNDIAPAVIHLKFAGQNAILPVTGDGNRSAGGFMLPFVSSAWVLCDSNYLFCGRETVNAISMGGGSLSSNQPQNGVWMIPLEPIDAEIARQRQPLNAAQQIAQAKAAEEEKPDNERRRTFLMKYDRNHNGTIDEDERDAAQDDPYYLKFRIYELHKQEHQ